jgi:hypothetical protein
MTEEMNLCVVSDLHCGCRLGLCPRDGVQLDDGGRYEPSAFQLVLADWWDLFWNEFVPEATKGEPFGVVCNGDALDGVHHGAVTQVSNNLGDQANIAYQMLKPVVDLCEGRYWHIRGTEAHVGPSGQEEERLAQRLGALPNPDGQYARWELWKMVGPKLCHILHHIGTTGSQAYESTALHKELTESYIEAARWNRKPPDLICRAHRHRYLETTIATAGGRAMAVVLPSWQGRTPFAWKIPGARLSTPQFGGIVIRYAHGELFIRSFVRTTERSAVE